MRGTFQGAPELHLSPAVELLRMTHSSNVTYVVLIIRLFSADDNPSDKVSLSHGLTAKNANWSDNEPLFAHCNVDILDDQRHNIISNYTN